MGFTTLTTQYGFSSLPASFLFLGLYSFLFLWFILQTCRRPRTVYFALSIFCSIRIAAFTIRSDTLLHPNSAGQNSSLIIGDLVCFETGIFILLYASFTLTLDFWSLSGCFPQPGLISGWRTFTLFVVALAINLNSVGTIVSPNAIYDWKSLSISSGARFLIQFPQLIHVVLVLTLLFMITTLSEQMRKRRERGGTVPQFRSARYDQTTIERPGSIYLHYPDEKQGFVGPGDIPRYNDGAKDGWHPPSYHITAAAPKIENRPSPCRRLAVIWILSMFRLISICRFGSPKYVDERFWYPLVVVPEFLTVCLFLGVEEAFGEESSTLSGV